MSEYQYYEFQAIDRPLDERAMAELRAITSRARITPTRLVNVYHWGDFKGDPDRLMDRYFDAFLYVATWGTRRLMLRVPRGAFGSAAAKPYCVCDVLRSRATPEHVVLEFHSEAEDVEDFEEGEGWLASLIPLRADLLAGDLRCLYLGWLAGVQEDEVNEDRLEPPVPPGLRQRSASLECLAEFLRLAPDLIEVAAAASSEQTETGETSAELAAWVTALPEAEKNRFMVRLMQGKAAKVRAELVRRRERSLAQLQGRRGVSAPAAGARRTVGSLLEARDRLAEERRRREAEQQARRARDEAAKRARYLDSFGGREEELWRSVEQAIATKQRDQYQEAVRLLRDLHEVGQRSGKAQVVEARFRQLRERHRRKLSLMHLLDQSGLPQ